MEFKEISPNNPRRDFNIMTYYPSDVFVPVFEKYGRFVYILHNKDDKQPHYHIALKTKNSLTLDRLHDLVDFEYSKLCVSKGIEYQRQRMTAMPLRNESIETAIDYFLHTNSDSVEQCKHQYYLTELRGNYDFIGRYNKQQQNNDAQENNETFLSDLTKKYESQSEFMRFMAKKYGRDFIKNYDNYVSFKYLLAEATHEEKIIADLEGIGLTDEYTFVENSHNFQSVEAFRQDLIKKLERLNKRYPNPEFKIIKSNESR